MPFVWQLQLSLEVCLYLEDRIDLDRIAELNFLETSRTRRRWTLASSKVGETTWAPGTHDKDPKVERGMHGGSEVMGSSSKLDTSCLLGGPALVAPSRDVKRSGLASRDAEDAEGCTSPRELS